MRRRDWIVAVGCTLAIAGSAVRIGSVLGRDETEGERLIPGVSFRLLGGLSCEIYLPAGFDRTRKHPLVFATSPSGHGQDLLPVWKDACDRFQWILVASNNFRNGKYSATDDALQLDTIALVRHYYPIDDAQIYATGLSGGGMRAHSLIAEHPDIFRGIVVNTGMMPQHYPGNDPFDATTYPRAKRAVFLASPTDFRFGEMKEDRRLLESVGWNIDWVEFAGGHTYAPPAQYVDAAAWLAVH